MKLKIVSDGKKKTYVTDESYNMVEGITKIEWSIELGELAKVTLTLKGIPVELTVEKVEMARDIVEITDTGSIYREYKPGVRTLHLECKSKDGDATNWDTFVKKALEQIQAPRRGVENWPVEKKESLGICMKKFGRLALLTIVAQGEGKAIIQHADGLDYMVSPKAKADYDEGFEISIVRNGRGFCIQKDCKQALAKDTPVVVQKEEELRPIGFPQVTGYKRSFPLSVSKDGDFRDGDFRIEETKEDLPIVKSDDAFVKKAIELTLEEEASAALGAFQSGHITYEVYSKQIAALGIETPIIGIATEGSIEKDGKHFVSTAILPSAQEDVDEMPVGGYSSRDSKAEEVILRHINGFDYMVSPKTKVTYDRGYEISVTRDGKSFSIQKKTNLQINGCTGVVFTEYNEGDDTWYKKAEEEGPDPRISVYDKRDNTWVGSATVEAVHNTTVFYFEDGRWWYNGGKEYDKNTCEKEIKDSSRDGKIEGRSPIGSIPTEELKKASVVNVGAPIDGYDNALVKKAIELLDGVSPAGSILTEELRKASIVNVGEPIRFTSLDGSPGDFISKKLDHIGIVNVDRSAYSSQAPVDLDNFKCRCGIDGRDFVKVDEGQSFKLHKCPACGMTLRLAK